MLMDSDRCPVLLVGHEMRAGYNGSEGRLIPLTIRAGSALNDYFSGGSDV
jgi:hypothetical protein